MNGTSLPDTPNEVNSPPGPPDEAANPTPDSPQEGAVADEVKAGMSFLERRFAEALGRLGSGKAIRAGIEWKTRCPVPTHTDTTPSFDFREKNGKLVFICRSGCSQDEVEAALAKVGFEKANFATGAKTDTHYIYLDAEGNQRFRKTRTDYASGKKKTFLWSRRVGDKWIPKLEGQNPPLYKLPEVLAAAKAGVIVRLVEGEKCSESMMSLMSLGYTATTAGGGSSDPLDTPGLLEPLRGADVELWPDNDEPGRRYVQNLARKLQGIAKTVRLVQWTKDRPTGYDIAELIDDCREAGLSDDAIKDLINLMSEEAIPCTPENVDTADWRDALDLRKTRDGDAVLVANFRNAALFIENEEPYTKRFRFNDFSQRAMIGDRPWKDADLLEVLEWLQVPERMAKISKDAVYDAVMYVANRHTFHPIKDYLNGLVYDGVPRINTWLVDHADAADTPYVRAVSAAWLISAVARVFKPGCQVDTALILESGQGTFKSTTIKILAEPWASTLSNVALHGKEAMEQIIGKWIVEMSELSGMNRSEVSQIKDFISRQNDYFRPSYGRVATDFPRSCVFVGSTNDEQYLRDDTGGRRFWPVKIGSFNLETLTKERDQIWAEATTRYRAGEKWYLSKELEVDAKQEQELRRVVDPWEETVGKFLAEKCKAILSLDLPHMPKHPSVSVAEILEHCLYISVAQQDQSANLRVVRLLTVHGWKRYRARAGDKVGWRYRPKEAKEA